MPTKRKQLSKSELKRHAALKNKRKKVRKPRNFHINCDVVIDDSDERLGGWIGENFIPLCYFRKLAKWLLDTADWAQQQQEVKIGQ